MNAIVVADRNWAIGRSNGLLFSLPGDMKHFRTLTSGGTVIMGRRTLDSFPGGRPLPKRRNIVITRDPDFCREGCEIVHHPEACVTQVDTAAPEADVFFPNLDALPEWAVEHAGEPITENGLTYRFVDYIRR